MVLSLKVLRLFLKNDIGNLTIIQYEELILHCHTVPGPGVTITASNSAAQYSNPSVANNEQIRASRELETHVKGLHLFSFIPFETYIIHIHILFTLIKKQVNSCCIYCGAKPFMSAKINF